MWIGELQTAAGAVLLYIGAHQCSVLRYPTTTHTDTNTPVHNGGVLVLGLLSCPESTWQFLSTTFTHSFYCMVTLSSMHTHTCTQCWVLTFVNCHIKTWQLLPTWHLWHFMSSTRTCTSTQTLKCKYTDNLLGSTCTKERTPPNMTPTAMEWHDGCIEYHTYRRGDRQTDTHFYIQ